MLSATIHQDAQEAMSSFRTLYSPERRYASRPRAKDEPPALAPAQPSPRTAELVEREDSGAFYLRTFTNGHYLWQPVASLATSIPDSGVWLSGGECHHAYWYNHGAYRRRAGRYFPVVKSGSATHAA